MAVETYVVKGTFEGEQLAVSVMGHCAAQALLTVKEFWPGAKIHQVSRQDEWSEEYDVSVR